MPGRKESSSQMATGINSPLFLCRRRKHTLMLLQTLPAHREHFPCCRSRSNNVSPIYEMPELQCRKKLSKRGRYGWVDHLTPTHIRMPLDATYSSFNFFTSWKYQLDYSKICCWQREPDLGFEWFC